MLQRSYSLLKYQNIIFQGFLHTNDRHIEIRLFQLLSIKEEPMCLSVKLLRVYLPLLVLIL